MNNDHQNSTIIIQGKFMECPSVLDLYSEIDQETWDHIVVETIAYYAMLKATNIVDPKKFSPEDEILACNLHETVKEFFSIDGALELKYNIDSIINNNVNLMLDADKHVTDIINKHADKIDSLANELAKTPETPTN